MKSRLRGRLEALRDSESFDFDDQGYVSLGTLLSHVGATREELIEYLETTDEFSILDDKIRANSGHNFPIKEDKFASVPPILIHSTTCSNVGSIIDGGKLIGYPVVSLSTDFQEAKSFVRADGDAIVHFLLDARLMLLDGVKILNTGGNTFNVIEEIPQKYIVGILEHSDELTDIPSLKYVDPIWTEKMSYQLDDGGVSRDYLDYLGIE